MEGNILITGAIIIGGVVAVGLIAGYYATYSVRSQVLGKTTWCGKSDSHSVALTFDDGPSEETEQILNILKDYDIKATFFMIGSQVERFPEVARRVAREGHQIGNHSFSHPIFLYQFAHQIRHQLESTQKIITNITGITPRLARPPCGTRTFAYFAAARTLGLKTIQWSVAGFDWKAIAPEKITENILKRVRPGSIVLLHDGDDTLKNSRYKTVLALPAIIEGMLSKNLRVAPLDELCDDTDKSAPELESICLDGDNIYE